MSSNKSETAVCGSLFEDLDDWEVITGCHQNWTSVSQLIETSVYFRLVWHKSSDMILSTLGLAQAYCAINLPHQMMIIHVHTYVLCYSELSTSCSIVMYAPLSMLNNGLCIAMLVWCMHGMC